MDAAANKPKTILSVGALIRGLLMQSPDVAGRVTRIFPVVIDEARLPYIAYRRNSLEARDTKGPAPGSEVAVIEVACFTVGYDEGVELAEAVRRALENPPGLRQCWLCDSAETWEDDAYIQKLFFKVRM